MNHISTLKPLHPLALPASGQDEAGAPYPKSPLNLTSRAMPPRSSSSSNGCSTRSAWKRRSGRRNAGNMLQCRPRHKTAGQWSMPDPDTRSHIRREADIRTVRTARPIRSRCQAAGLRLAGPTNAGKRRVLRGLPEPEFVVSGFRARTLRALPSIPFADTGE
jgi:hypothetical protein